MAKQKSWFGVWGVVKPADLNRLLKPFGCRLQARGRRQDDQVLVTAEPLGTFEAGPILSEDPLALLREMMACFDPDSLLISDRERLVRALDRVQALVRQASDQALAPEQP